MTITSAIRRITTSGLFMFSTSLTHLQRLQRRALMCRSVRLRSRTHSAPTAFGRNHQLMAPMTLRMLYLALLLSQPSGQEPTRWPAAVAPAWLLRAGRAGVPSGGLEEWCTTPAQWAWDAERVPARAERGPL